MFRLVATNTVEEIIYKRASRKAALSRDIMQGVATSVIDDVSGVRIFSHVNCESFA